MNEATRKMTLGAVLVICLMVSAWTASHPSEDMEPAKTASQPEAAGSLSTGARKESPQRLALERLGPREPILSDADPFVPKTWFVPPPPAPAEAPPKPTAPPLPFQYVGKFENAGGGDKPVFYLAKGSEAYSVKAGDKVDDHYRFDGIEHGALVFTYLPLSTKQTLPLQ